MMCSLAYPTSLANVRAWVQENEVTTREGNIRFMEFVVLNCIASIPATQNSLVLKGGNALRFAYQSSRSTKDLDFSVTAKSLPDDEQHIRDTLSTALRLAERQFGVKAKCQRVKRNPSNPDATRPTYDIAVAYQFPGDAYFNNFENRIISTVIPVEISFNDLICETTPWNGVRSLQVCSLEDILAEKLRALLQQKSRNRNRSQDVYGIARYAHHPDLDCNKIGRYLQQKSSIRDIEVRKSAFDTDIRDRASHGYDTHLQRQSPDRFIPFADAWREVLSLVQALPIPD